MATNNGMEGRMEKTKSSIKALDKSTGLTSELQAVLETNLQEYNSSIQNLFEYMDGKLEELETQLKESKSKATGTPVSSPLAGSDPTASNMIKELEIRLEKTEEERNKIQSERDDLYADLQRWRDEFDDSQEARNGIEVLLKQKIEEEQKRSRALFEKLQAMKGNIRVMCRIRPASADTPDEELVDFGPREKGEFSNFWGRMQIPVERRNAIGNIITSTKSFDFERIFGPEETNDDVFSEISDLVDCALQGEKVGIFAYGQTGSGKTHTLSHKNPEVDLEDGVIPRTVALMFKIAETSDSHSYSIALSILEIHIDNIYDLQEPIEGQKVQTRIEEAKFLNLDTLESAERMIEEASRLRVSSSTSKNAMSSRSHLILTFQITRESLDGGQVDRGFLYLVDLAGSERSAAGGLEGTQLQEGIKINKSLMSLNLVITALGKGTHAAYDTALTKALRPVLAHDSKTLMFVMISPLKRDLVTSIQTLEKGQEATNAKLAAVNRNDTRRQTPSTPSGSRTTQPALSSGLKAPAGRSDPRTPSPFNNRSTSSTPSGASRGSIPRSSTSRFSQPATRARGGSPAGGRGNTTAKGS
ncbi:P-loop containing nucleoside triphosphate hydrolase protein [Annulohypoxylon bovei var. microspora]|nr:P-loop containing nucleoside triphosphate hydrolase protein [Annulohypoxylon bovei var. microspora]